jgi:8-oxo-dGTP diphosphatase
VSKYYKNNPTYYIAVDCIIFGFDQEKLKVLLIKRDFEPHKGEWSLMGGFLKNNESLDEAGKRVLESLTGLTDIYLEQLYTYGEINRDDADRVISVAYFALINTTVFNEKYSNKQKAKWFELEKIPKLIFDHETMIDKALKRLTRRSKNQPIGFELLPEKFTIPQLQKLYEAIWNTMLDKRNFRRKILSINVLKKLDEKEIGVSKKGAYFYTFDKDKYDRHLTNGYYFEL